MDEPGPAAEWLSDAREAYEGFGRTAEAAAMDRLLGEALFALDHRDAAAARVEEAARATSDSARRRARPTTSSSWRRSEPGRATSPPRERSHDVPSPPVATPTTRLARSRRGLPWLSSKASATDGPLPPGHWPTRCRSWPRADKIIRTADAGRMRPTRLWRSSGVHREPSMTGLIQRSTSGRGPRRHAGNDDITTPAVRHKILRFYFLNFFGHQNFFYHFCSDSSSGIVDFISLQNIIKLQIRNE